MQALFTFLTRCLICLASFKATRRRFGRYRRRFRLRRRRRYKLRRRRRRYGRRRRRLRGLRRRRRRRRYRRRKYRGRKRRRRRRYGRRRLNRRRRRRRRTYFLKIPQFRNSLLIAGEKSFFFFSWVLFGFPSCNMCSQNSIQMSEENRKIRRRKKILAL